MVEKWVIDVITDLRLLGVTQKKFAEMCGYSEAYMCQVLRGKKDTKQAKETIQHTLQKLQREVSA